MDDNQITIIRALDDADVCGKAALERLGALTTGIDDIRREFLLWTWLRMRSYARHAAVTAYGNINKSEFKDAGLARWREAIQPLIEAHAIENQLKERKFFEGDWVGNDLKSQMKEREVNKRIDDLYSNPVMWLDEEKLKDDELAECREVVRLRTEFRAICAEIESVRGWSPRDPYIVNNGDLIEFRRSDGKL